MSSQKSEKAFIFFLKCTIIQGNQRPSQSLKNYVKRRCRVVFNLKQEFLLKLASDKRKSERVATNSSKF